MVFGAVQASQDHPAVGVFLRVDSSIDLFSDPGGESLEVGRRKWFLFFRRHLTEIEGVLDIVPGLRRRPVLNEVGGKSVEAQVALLLLLAVALEAVLGEDGSDILLKINRSEERASGKEEKKLERSFDGADTYPSIGGFQRAMANSGAMGSAWGRRRRCPDLVGVSNRCASCEGALKSALEPPSGTKHIPIQGLGIQ